MEFATDGRLTVRINPNDVGKRVSVRSLTESDQGGGKFTDTVGVLTSWTSGVLSITRRNGERAQVRESLLVAGKVVPAAPARRRGLPAANVRELVTVAARAWPPVEEEWLGGWRLRSAAGDPVEEAEGPVAGTGDTAPEPRSGEPLPPARRHGFTRRANSALVTGDSGLPLDVTLERVTDWYRRRGLPPYLQVTTGAADTQELLAAALAERGWHPETTAEVWIGGLAPLADLDGDTGQVVLTRELGAAWAGRCDRFADRAPLPHERAVLTGGPSVWFAQVPGPTPDAPAAAIGRSVLDGRWAGYTAIEVDPARRRTGLATAVMAALARQALAEGCSAAYLEVEVDNLPARALYERLGLARHHTYQHWRAPEHGPEGQPPTQG